MRSAICGIFAVLAQVTGVLGDDPAVISPSDLAELAAEVWKDLPTSADVTLYRERQAPPANFASVKETVEHVQRRIEQNLPPGIIRPDHDFQNHVASEATRVYRDQQQPRHLRQRIRIAGALYRIDEVILKDGETIDESTPYEYSFVNGGAPENGSPDHFCYYHTLKHAVRDDKRKWKPEPILETLSVGRQMRTLFKTLLGEVAIAPDGTESIVPSSDKMAEISADTNSHAQVLASQELYKSQNCLRIEVRSRVHERALLAAILLDRDRPSRTYRVEMMDAKSGKVRYVEERSEYDDELDGLPRVWTRRTISPDGKEVFDQCVISAAEIGNSIPKDVFEFRPPEGYVVYDARPATPIITGLAHKPSDGPKNQLREREWNSYVIFGNVLVIVFLVLFLLVKRSTVK